MEGLGDTLPPGEDFGFGERVERDVWPQLMRRLCARFGR